VTDITLVDGFRSESPVFSTDAKASTGEALIAAGIRRLEAAAFLPPHAVPQLADAADVIARLKAPGIELGCGVPNVNGAWRAVAAGVDRISVSVSASETFNLKTSRRTIATSLESLGQIGLIASDARVALRGEVSAAFGCPFEGDVGADAVLRVVERLVAIGVDEILLADTTGMATPPLVDGVLERVRARHPQVALAMRFSDARGLALVNVLRSLELGVERFQSACGGAGCVCTGDLVFLLDELGIGSGIDLAALIGVAQSLQALFGHELPGHVIRSGPRLRTQRSGGTLA
jgi:hydroxymethylglutaryl-CoA lyase